MTAKKPALQKDPRSGVALILVMVSIAFMAIVIVEVIAASRVDLRIAINARNRLQAQYLAQSNAKLQILRLNMYKEVRNLKDGNGNVPIDATMIDRIWNTTMPEYPLPGMKSTWPGGMSGVIKSEGSKIPINLLDGNRHMGFENDDAAKAAQKDVKEQITGLINGLLETEEFDEKYRGLEPKDLIDPLTDWVDADNDLQGGGDENREYERLDPPYRTRNFRMPTLSELHMVQGWTDDLVNRLAGNFSILNTSTKVNPLYVSKERLKAWGPELTAAELAYIDQKRVTNPELFKSMSDLENFVRNDPELRGGDKFTIPENLKDSKNQSDREQVFIVESAGIVGSVVRKIRLGIVIPAEIPKKPSRSGTTPPPEPKPGKLLEPQVAFVEEYL
jgi:general secretion pathway protein K